MSQNVDDSEFEFFPNGISVFEITFWNVKLKRTFRQDKSKMQNRKDKFLCQFLVKYWNW